MLRIKFIFGCIVWPRGSDSDLQSYSSKYLPGFGSDLFLCFLRSKRQIGCETDCDHAPLDHGTRSLQLNT